MAHRVTLIPGDGVGPELSEATRRVLEATGVGFDWDVRGAGVEVMESAGTPLPAETLDSVKENRVALKGPITTPIGTGFRSVNVALRHELGLYACLRPCKTYAGVRSRYDNVDLVVVRENTEDLYAGIEYEAGTPEAEQVIADLNKLQKKQIGQVHMRDLFEEYPWRRLFGALTDMKFEGYCFAEIPESADPIRVLKYFKGLFYAYQHLSV